MISQQEIDGRARALLTGVRVTLALVIASLAYLLATWYGPHRPVMAAVLLVAAADAVVVLHLPRRTIIELGLRDRVLVAWNLLHIVAITSLALLDGGLASPFLAMLFVSVVFAALVLERRWVLAIALIDVGALVLTALVDQAPNESIALVGPSLMVTAALCATIAGQQSSRLDDVAEAKEDTVKRLALAVDIRDHETGGHVERISAYCVLIAEGLGLPPLQRDLLRRASPMHDVGKIAVPDAVLLKPGPLDDRGRTLMQAHAQAGHDLLTGSRSEVLRLGAEIALTHHERFDGSGYPQGLEGDAIPLAGRIVAVADVFDALTSDRVYRPAMAIEDALTTITRGRGTSFDPVVLDAFLSQLDRVLAVHGASRAGAGGSGERPAPARTAALTPVAS